MKKLLLVVLAVLLFSTPAFASSNGDVDDRVTAIDYIYLNLTAFNDAVGTTEMEGLGGLSASFNFPTTACTMEVSSSSTSDDDGGTGAVTIKITGLDANYALLTETVAMDGVTPVVTASSFLRVNNVEVASVGSSNTNVGTIYVYNGTDTAGVPDTATTIWGAIAVGMGQSLDAKYTSPALYTVLVKNMDLTANNFCKFEVLTRNAGSSIWERKMIVHSPGGSLEKHFNYGFEIPPGVDMIINAQGSSAVVGASMNCDLKVFKKIVVTY